MNPYEFHQWYPSGTSRIIAAGGSNYIALYGEGEDLVLKFPLVPPNENGLYDVRDQTYRDRFRSHALHGLFVEGEILRQLGDHPRIIKLHGPHESGILLEYMSNGCVARYLRDNPGITSLQQKRKWIRQAAEAIAYIHTKNVLHCDISIGNLLLDANLDLKLADFQGKLLAPDGSVRYDGGSTESTMACMPRADYDSSNVQTDLFAFGTTLFYIMTGGLPFPDLDPGEDEDEIQARFRAGELPQLERSSGGEVVRGLWMGSYQSAQDVVRDLLEVEKLGAETSDAE